MPGEVTGVAKEVATASIQAAGETATGAAGAAVKASAEGTANVGRTAVENAAKVGQTERETAGQPPAFNTAAEFGATADKVSQMDSADIHSALEKFVGPTVPPTADKQTGQAAPEPLGNLELKTVINPPTPDGRVEVAAPKTDSGPQTEPVTPTAETTTPPAAPDVTAETKPTESSRILNTPKIDALDLRPSAAAGAQPQEQQAADAKADSQQSRFGKIKDAVRNRFTRKPLSANTSKINALDLRRTPEENSSAPPAAEPQPASVDAGTDTPGEKPNVEGPKTGEPPTTTQDMKDEFINGAQFKEPSHAERVQGAQVEEVSSQQDTPPAAEAQAASADTGTKTDIQGEKPNVEGPKTDEAVPPGEPAKDGEEKPDTKAEEVKTPEQMKTEQSLKRDEAVARLIKNNPDLDLSRPDVQQLLQEAQDDQSGEKFKTINKTMDLIDQKSEKAVEDAKALGLPEDLKDFQEQVNKIAPGDLKSFADVLRTIADTMDKNGNPDMKKKSEDLKWWVELLTILLAGVAKVPEIAKPTAELTK